MSTTLPAPEHALSYRFRERVDGWGLAVGGYSQLFRPTQVEEFGEVFDVARALHRTVGLRGAGRCYGDAALNTDGIVLDTSACNRILSFDPASGLIEMEPGVTVGQMWRTTIPYGWWPPVVPGTMTPTLGGVASANIHGKNNWRYGPLGEHIRSFDLLLPTGESMTCTPTQNPECFFAVLGGFGMFGLITRLTLQLKRVYSGHLMVEPVVTHNLTEMLDVFAAHQESADYMVGWVDCVNGGSALGRGLIHLAWYLPEGADAEPHESLRVAAQDLPSRILGVFPKSLVPLVAAPLVNNFGVGLVNQAKWWSSNLELRGHRYWQTHAGFAFLLDYVPNWRGMYRPDGLIQYQCFVPKEAAAEVFGRIVKRCRLMGLPSYLGVTKRHRPDPFLLSHAVDGYSLALDFKVTRNTRKDLWALLQSLDAIVLEAGGRFYFAKDLTLQADRIGLIWPESTLGTARKLKNECDPEHLLQTDLSRRLLRDWLGR